MGRNCGISKILFSLLKQQFVPGLYNTLSNNIDQALDVILDHIEDNFIGVFQRGHFRHVRFPYEMWGVHDRVQNDLPRTNNDVEGWHNRLNQHVGCHHATIWKLIGVLKEDGRYQPSKFTPYPARPE